MSVLSGLSSEAAARPQPGPSPLVIRSSYQRTVLNENMDFSELVAEPICNCFSRRRGPAIKYH